MGPARSYSSQEWDEKSGSSKTNRRPLETDWIFWTFRNSGQNSGQKSTEQNKSTAKQQKALKTNGFQGFDGGDKRDRTADLLNAICLLNAIAESGDPNAQMHIIIKSKYRRSDPLHAG